jgi:hypothetical protein
MPGYLGENDPSWPRNEFTVTKGGQIRTEKHDQRTKFLRSTGGLSLWKFDPTPADETTLWP